MMNRDELGREMHRAFCAVIGDEKEWDALSESEKEDGRKIAERFLAATETHAAPTAPRTFHARVALMGHRDLGLCRVTEAALAGAPMLRVEVDGAVEWVNPAAIYSAREVPDAEALAEIARVAAEQERHARIVAESRARRNAERAEVTADVVIDRAHDLTALRASLPGLLRRHDFDLTAALEAEGITSCSEFSNTEGRPVGIVVEGDHSDALNRVAASLGFTPGVTRPPLTDDELDTDVPF